MKFLQTNNNPKKVVTIFLFVLLTTINVKSQSATSFSSGSHSSSNIHQKIVTFFQEWRKFEKPPIRNGAPDYTLATFERRWPVFKNLQKKFLAIDTTGWSIDEQVDWHVIWAEMNGYDFNHRILKPWQRDPAFYKTIWTERSDVPAHEGPTHHMVVDLWKYHFPLVGDERQKLIKELQVIRPLNEQAKLNLTGNAKDLWTTGIRDIKTQENDLKELLENAEIKNDAELQKLINECISSTQSFIIWLQKESLKKNGPSGIGKENYDWYQRYVHLVPYNWEKQVMLLQRELDRAWASLKLEEQRNKNLPPLNPVTNSDDYTKLAAQATKSLIQFLDKNDMVTVKPYFESALKAHEGKYVPSEKRNFFLITSHHDPRPLFSHFYHWFELARMDNEPHTCEIRRVPMLYNIFDTRNEGFATAVEEIFMNAGLYDDSPKSREIVYILVAQRAARGLGSLYAHANQMTMQEAGSIHSDYTPRGWMKTEKELKIFEQHLYLQQPGYGSSYITGKAMVDHLMMEYAKMKESKLVPFSIKEFLDQLTSNGNIPISLTQWEMTGNDSEIRKLTSGKK
ncbi:MAG: hypothetical protein ACO29O_09130 [Chitinophagaceae bacterium]